MIEIRAIVSEETRDQILARMKIIRENGFRKSFADVAGQLLDEKILSSIIFPTGEHHEYCPKSWGQKLCACTPLKEADEHAKQMEQTEK